MKNFKSSESRDGGRDRRDERSSFGKRANFKDSGFKSGGFSKPSFGGKSFGRGGDFKNKSFGGDRGEVTMNKATCSECSNICEVPFKPNQDRPVFCSNCFMSKRDGTFEKNDERKGNFRENARREERVSYSNPILSGQNASNSSAEIADLKKQITNLNTKIDSLASVVDKFMTGASVSVSAKTVEVIPIRKEVAVKEVIAKSVEAKPAVKKVIAKKEITKSSVKAPAKVAATKKVTPVVAKKVTTKAVVKKTESKTVATKTIAPKKSVVAKKSVLAKKK